MMEPGHLPRPKEVSVTSTLFLSQVGRGPVWELPTPHTQVSPLSCVPHFCFGSSISLYLDWIVIKPGCPSGLTGVTLKNAMPTGRALAGT